jgi:hypothetical protein
LTREAGVGPRRGVPARPRGKVTAGGGLCPAWRCREWRDSAPRRRAWNARSGRETPCPCRVRRRVVLQRSDEASRSRAHRRPPRVRRGFPAPAAAWPRVVHVAVLYALGAKTFSPPHVTTPGPLGSPCASQHAPTARSARSLDGLRFNPVSLPIPESRARVQSGAWTGGGQRMRSARSLARSEAHPGFRTSVAARRRHRGGGPVLQKSSDRSCLRRIGPRCRNDDATPRHR